jgi:TonB family protein
MVVGALAQGQDRPSRRRGTRYRVQAPLDITVLRSGIPDTLPGRSVNLGEGGLAAVLAGELAPGEAVGVEIRLPLAPDPLRTRALVRHSDKLRSGMEFVGLSPEQQAAIRDWAGTAKAETVIGGRPLLPSRTTKTSGSPKSGGPPPPIRRRRRGWIYLLVAAGILLAVLWWRWNRGWEDLESDLQKNTEKTEAIKPQVNVPADEMQTRVTHRVDPDYPAAARRAHLQGVIVLEVVIGRDGSVVDVRPRNGPEMLAQAATNALRWWKFEPYRIDGKPVVVETTVAVEFKP